jgi:hypothetical protein
MIIELIVKHGLIYTGGFILIILVSVLINPRIWMQDFSDSLQKDLPPKNRNEIKQTFVTGFLFSLFIVGFPLYSLSSLLGMYSGTLSRLDSFIHTFLMMMICNILYWLIFDILIFNIIVNRIRTIPGLKKQIKFSGWKRQVFGLMVGIITCAFISGFVVCIAGFFV